MLEDDKAVIHLGVAGALVPAGMRDVISTMIRSRMVDVIVSTGANLFHDYCEAVGFHHYLGSAEVDDTALREARIDRIYDTYADDDELTEGVARIADFASKIEQREYSSREFLALLGAGLKDESSLLATAAKERVPIYCPALADSAIGIGVTKHIFEHGQTGLVINHILDNLEMCEIKRTAKRTAVILLGGGVPKNYINQAAPMLECLGIEVEGHTYAVQVTTDDPKWGGLSGCTFEEAQSWGKVGQLSKFATVYLDATIGLPILVSSALPRQPIERKRRIFQWSGHKLEGLVYE